MTLKKVGRTVGLTTGKYAAHATIASGRLAVSGVRYGIRRTQRFPSVSDLPAGELVDVPGRGRVFVVDTGAPTASSFGPEAPTLLLFHGLATTAYLTWFSAINALRADYRVIMFDQRWHGRGIVSDRFVLEDCTDDAAALLDVLKVDQAIVVGYSMGGALAQVFWERHADRTAGLVLASTAMAWKGNAGEALFYKGLEAANAKFHTTFHDRVAAVSDGLAAAELSESSSDDISQWAWAQVRSTSMWSLPEVMAALGRFNAEAALATVTVPTAVVVTDKDKAIPTKRQLAMAEAIPGAEVFHAPGGHTSLVFDVAHWRPIFLDAVAYVAGRVHQAQAA